MYVADTGNNRICEFTYENNEFTYVKEVTGYKDAEGKDVKLNGPQDCICDRRWTNVHCRYR